MSNPLITQLANLIRSARLDLSSEKRAQGDLEAVLKSSGIVFDREFRLSAKDIVDFLIQGIAVELKLKNAKKMDVYKQLCRYAKSDQVTSIILASSTSMGLPQQIDGKDVYFVKLGDAWL